MEDFMDNLVREVEGNIRPIRSERLEEYPAEPAPMQREELWGRDAQATGRLPVFRDASGMSRPAPVYYEAQRGPEPVYYDVPDEPRQRNAFGEPGMINRDYSSFSRQTGYGSQSAYRVMPDSRGMYGNGPVPQAPPVMPVQQSVQAPQNIPAPPQNAPASGGTAPAAPTESAGQGTAGNSQEKASSNEGAEKLERDLFLHIHRENVKCYRNTQATIVENTNIVKQAEEENHSNVHKWLVGLLVLGIINLGASALIILHMIFGFI